MSRVWHEPVDAIHAMSLDAVVDIRRMANAARRRLGIQERCYERRPHTHQEGTCQQPSE